jgi:excisionase family DNA binding protein
MVYSSLMTTPLQRLKEALEAHRQTLDNLEGALLKFEGILPQEGSGWTDGGASELLSMEEVCQTLGMGKSWTYRRIKSGEIPSIKLGRSIKIKRQDLDEYLESRRYQPEQER